MDFKGKIALVTGGASGIGRATVTKFAELGAAVIFTDINDNVGPSLEAELKAAGYDVRFLISDATNDDEVVALIDLIISDYGRLDIAVNNVGNMAGGDTFGVPIHETPNEAFAGTVNVSFKSNFYAMKHEIAQMLKQGGGVIANTSSIAGSKVFELTTPTYSAAKAATNHMTRFAAVAYADKGIRVNAVAPGIIETPSLAATPKEIRDAALALLPAGKFQQAEEVANALVWLCSDEASAVNGVILPVDGGYSAK